MKIVTEFETLDGKRHLNAQAARSHAENVYWRQVNRLEHAMILMTKTGQISEYIHQNLPEFLKLVDLKADAEIPTDDSEEEG